MTVIIRRRLSFVTVLVVLLSLLWGQVPRAGEQASGRVLAPVPLEEALRAESASTSELSPDGALVVFLVYESWRRARTGGAYFLPSGQASGFSSARLYLADTKTGAVVPLGDEPVARWSTAAPSWAPDGKSLAFISDRDGHPRIWRWERQTGRITRVSDAIIIDPTRRRTHETWRPLQWTADGRRIVARVLPEGMSLAALVQHSTQRAARVGDDTAASGEPTAIVYPRPAAAADAKSSRKPGDPGSVFIARYSHFFGDLAAIDVASGRVKRLASRVHVERYEVSPDGRRLAAYDVEALRIFDIDTGAELASDPVPASLLPRVELRWAPTSDAVLHLVDGALRIVPVRGEAAAIPNLTLRTLPVWSPSGQAFYAMDGQRLLRLNGLGPPDVVATITGGRVVSWLFDDSHRETLFVKPGVRKLWLSTRADALSPVQLLEVSLDSGSVQPVGAPASGHERARIEADVIGRAVVYQFEDASHPPNLWLAHPGDAPPLQLSKTAAVFDRYVLGEPRIIEWLSDDGDRRHGVLLLPAGYKAGTRVPMIVSVYGGTPSVVAGLNEFGVEGGIDNHQLLATRGYAVLVPESEIHVGTPMLDLAKNVLPGVSKAVELGFADERRLGVMGHSFGGYTTLALIVQTRRFAAAIASGSISNMASVWGDSWDDGESESIPWVERKDYPQSRVGSSPWERRDRLIENSPFFYLDRVETPLLLVHGEIDPVPVLQADQTYFGLRRLGKTVEYARYANAGHNMTDPTNELDLMRRRIAWFDRFLKATPVKPSR